MTPIIFLEPLELQSNHIISGSTHQPLCTIILYIVSFRMSNWPQRRQLQIHQILLQKSFTLPVIFYLRSLCCLRNGDQLAVTRRIPGGRNMIGRFADSGASQRTLTHGRPDKSSGGEVFQRPLGTSAFSTQLQFKLAKGRVVVQK